MSHPPLSILAPLCLFAAAHAQDAAPPPATPPATPPVSAKSQEKSDAFNEATDLSVLYAGFPGGEREKNFVDFLSEWFPEVKTISLEKLNAKSAEGFDVVVADWQPHYKDGKYQSGTDPKASLGADYRKPTITIGSVGSVVPGGKIDWL